MRYVHSAGLTVIVRRIWCDSSTSAEPSPAALVAAVFAYSARADLRRLLRRPFKCCAAADIGLYLPAARCGDGSRYDFGAAPPTTDQPH